MFETEKKDASEKLELPKKKFKNERRKIADDTISKFKSEIDSLRNEKKELITTIL